MMETTTHSNGSSGSPPDHYRVLHLKAGADAAGVEQAYWYLARRYNAALESNPDARVALDALNEAYHVLSSPVLRREYDFSHNIEPPAGGAPRQALSSVMNLTAERARWRQESGSHSALASPLALAPPRIDLPDLKKLPWRKIVGGVVALLLGAIALFEGAEPGLVVALIVVGLVFASLPALGNEGKQARGEKPTLAPRHPTRPENLGDALIPRGTSRQTKRIVYEIYGWGPHLGPADVRAVTRYAVLTQRFMETERRLILLEEEGQSGQTLQVVAEQRALATELRLHEALLNIASVAGENEPTAG